MVVTLKIQTTVLIAMGMKGDDECLISGIVEIVGTYRSFAAMKEDGTVYTWGYGF